MNKNIKKTKYELNNYILNENISEIDEEKIKYITFPMFDNEESDVLAFYTTKCGGYSKGNAKGFNLKYDLDDSIDDVNKNYHLLSDVLDIQFNNLTMSHQVHETNIMIVDENQIGKGISKEIDYNSVDGLITNIKNVPLVTVYADCTPIFFYDKENKVVGMAHGGWKGTVKGIVKEMLEMLKKNFNSNSNNIKVVIGPAIGMECYEVSDKVIDDIKILCKQNQIELTNLMVNDKKHVDLKEINKRVLMANGVREENIEVTNLCTKCRSDIFYSHRVSGTKRGCQAGIIMLK